MFGQVEAPLERTRSDAAVEALVGSPSSPCDGDDQRVLIDRNGDLAAAALRHLPRVNSDPDLLHGVQFLFSLAIP